MTEISWWLVDAVSRILESDERDAVLGDFAESGVRGGKALRDLLGLVLRRQAALWKDWRPWVALFGVVGPVGVVLSRRAFGLSLRLAMYFLTYWRFGVRFEDGLTVPQDIVAFVCQSLALIFYSWTGGFVLGSLSRRTIWVNAALFCFVSLVAGGALRDVAVLTIFRGLPLVAEAVLFLLPLIWGVREGLRLGTMRVRSTILLVATMATITMLATWTGGWWHAALVAWSQGVWQENAGGQIRRLVSLAVVTWPIGYMVAVASCHSWKSRCAAR